MRKFRLFSLLLLAIIFIAVNCTKEGPEGPVGATGPQGPAGAGGATGTANVVYSAWFTLIGWHDSTMLDQGLCKVDYRDAPGVTAAIISNGVVLSFVAPSATSTFAYAMPWIFTQTNPNVIVSFRPSVGRMVFYNTQINSVAGGIVPGAGYVYRYVIVPGGVAGGRMINGAAAGYTVDRLQSMTYQQIASMFNIPANGSNM